MPLFRSPFRNLSVAILCAASAFSQQKSIAEMLPVTLNPEPFLVLDSVVTEQWPSTLPDVNAPANMLVLNPGQCVRVAAIASGKGHEHFFDQASIGFTIHCKGGDDTFSVTPAAATKLIKPEGGDFVAGALSAINIKNPFPTTAAITASSQKWCVPQAAPDGDVEVSADVKLDGKETHLRTTAIHMESLGTAASRSFADEKEFSEWVLNYHKMPEPGRLLAAFRYLGANAKSGALQKSEAIILQFLKSALKHDAATARGFGPFISADDSASRMLTLTLLSQAGVTLTQPPQLTDEDKKFISEAGSLPDPYDMQPNQELFSKLDMLWSDFSATGRVASIAAVVSALAWRSDYDAFDEMRKKGIKPPGLTDSIIRGVTYTAAGWSLGSFKRSDPLATDYIAWIAAQPTTSANIRKELSELNSNPAFKRQ
ncbi:MAG TPA: hypothetical protein VGD64_06085 [Acidisarcina sp.]